MTLSKYVIKYGHMRKRMVKFLIKFGGRGIKIARINFIHVVKPLILCNILRDIPNLVTSS